MDKSKKAEIMLRAINKMIEVVYSRIKPHLDFSCQWDILERDVIYWTKQHTSHTPVLEGVIVLAIEDWTKHGKEDRVPFIDKLAEEEE